MSIIETRNQLKKFIKEKCILHGDFQLASGGASNIYVDLRKIATGDSLYLAAVLFRDSILGQFPNTEVVGGMASGINMMAVATLSPPILMATIVYKEGGELKVANPQPIGTKVFYMEDIFNTGRSLAVAMRRLKEIGNTPTGAVALVDRESGGIEALKNEFKIPVSAIYKMSELLN